MRCGDVVGWCNGKKKLSLGRCRGVTMALTTDPYLRGGFSVGCRVRVGGSELSSSGGEMEVNVTAGRAEKRGSRLNEGGRKREGLKSSRERRGRGCCEKRTNSDNEEEEEEKEEEEREKEIESPLKRKRVCG